MFYESWFNLSAAPFSISPDPRYLFLTQGHREALAHLLYGVSGNGGFVLLTGEIGAGKTTVCRCLLEQLPDGVDVALILNPKLEAKEFLQAICDEFGINLYSDREVTLKLLVDSIYQYLLEAYSQGKNTVLIVDEAQNLSPDVLEHLRLLTNLETSERKLLQIMLIGQPELRDLVASPLLRQMAQRITARFHLDVLSQSETEGYIKHRLKVAGCTEPLFQKNSVRYIWKRCGGVPRLINAVCDRALLGARVGSKRQVTVDIARRAASEVLGHGDYDKRKKLNLPLATKVSGAALIALALLCIILLWFAMFYEREDFNMLSGPKSPAKIFFEVAENPKLSGQLLVNAEAQGQQVSGTSRERDLSTERAGRGPVPTPGAGSVKNDLALKLEQLPAETWPKSTLLAQQYLLNLWGKQYLATEHQSACDYARTQGLACLLGRGSLKELAILNRPAVLSLENRHGAQFRAAITGLSHQYADIYFSGESYRVGIEELSGLWGGEYLLFWRTPTGYQGVLKEGASGDVVSWIAEVLAIKRNGDYPRDYDRELAHRVALFQKSKGLAPDGETGPRTIIALNNFAKLGAPTLINSAIQ